MTMPLWSDPPSSAIGGVPPRAVTVIRLAGEIARSFAGVGRVVVEGEVHRPTQSKGGWIFFTLRDRAAEIKVALPRAKTRHSRVVDGERVAVVGVLEWINERGQAQLRAEEVTPVGAGAIAAAINQARQRLQVDGLIDRPRRPIPLLPAAIGVVCGSEAAVKADIQSVVASRFPGYPLVVQETTVTGPGAAFAIIEALEFVVRRPGVEVVVLARGGGDATALLPWSDETLCRAVASCLVPVVSAIGHEGDHPLCDEVADLRCGTPSIAAHTVVPDGRALVGHLDRLAARRGAAWGSQLEAARTRMGRVDARGALGGGARHATNRLEGAHRRLVAAHPGRRLAGCEQRLAACDWRRPAGERIGMAAGRLLSEGRHLRALSPARVLDRGYAVVRRADGEVVRRAAQVSAAQVLEIRLAAGSLRATVLEARNE
jgi:exodeoxyribonuclease VII large subunit